MTYGTKAANTARNMADIATVDTGNPARCRHNGGLVLAPRTATEGGIQTSVGARAKFECVLDALLGIDPGKGALAGTQGSRADRAAVARSRYEAGMRLRRIFTDAGLVGVKAFDPSGGRGGESDISDKQALARRSYNDVMRKLGDRAHMASGPCCYDAMPDNDRWMNNIRCALDDLCAVLL